MKPINIYGIIFFFIYANVYAQMDFKRLEKSFTKINDSLYVSKYETTIFDYKLFLESIIKENPNEYFNVVYDSLNLMNLSEYDSPLANTYFNHPAFKLSPVTNISYEAVLRYCKWLSDEYNKFKKRKFNNVLFRLPTVEEWENAARFKDKKAVYGWHSRFNSTNDKKLANYFCGYFEPNNLYYTSNVESFTPTKAGLFNISGNVSEMTTLKNITKGGNCRDGLEKMLIEMNHQYNGMPNNLVGFRLFMIIIQN